MSKCYNQIFSIFSSKPEAKCWYFIMASLNHSRDLFFDGLVRIITLYSGLCGGPAKGYVHVLIPGTCECYIIEKESLQM